MLYKWEGKRRNTLVEDEQRTVSRKMAVTMKKENCHVTPLRIDKILGSRSVLPLA
jgi:hypothetical protein